jgi:lipoate-protein ligase A
VVLGSTQPESIIDAGRAASEGIAVARRRSGGGAVLVAPGDPVWIDVWVPIADSLWHADVGRAFDWLGHTWVRALGALGAGGLSVNGQGARVTTRWSGLVCFGGVGAGEVVTPSGLKVVGLAQRRNRHGALFQGACVLHWEAQPMADLLALSDPDRRAAGRELAGAAQGVRDLRPTGGHHRPVTPEAVVASFLASLL